MGMKDSNVIKFSNTDESNNGTSSEDNQNDDTLQRWQMAFHLQFSLEIPHIIKTFITHLENDLVFDSMQYTHENLKMDFIDGDKQRHYISYQLTLENDDLGEIIITRRTKFNDDEISFFEERLCTLVYPLRNGVKYQEALNRSMFDPLTGISNRVGLLPSLHSELELAKRHGTDLSVLVVDLDHFKTVNDTYGHACGDYVLTSVAQQLSEAVRDSDLFYRYGGDEFVLILRRTDKIGAVTLAERVRNEVDTTKYTYKKVAINMSVSIGIATHLEQDTNETILERADEALYRAKGEGRNLVSL